VAATHGCPRDGGSSHRGGVDVPPGIGECTCNNDEYHEDQDERGAFLDDDDWAEDFENDKAEQEAFESVKFAQLLYLRARSIKKKHCLSLLLDAAKADAPTKKFRDK